MSAVADDPSSWYPSERQPEPSAVESIFLAVGGIDGIYGRAFGGGFVRVPYDGSGATEAKFGEGIVGVVLGKDSEPCLLTLEDLSNNLFLSCRIEPDKGDPQYQSSAKWWLSPHIPMIRKLGSASHNYDDSDYEFPVALASDGDRLIVLTNERLLFVTKNQSEWKEQALTKQFDFLGSSRYTTRIVNGDTLWYGDDQGEFGGHLLRINLKSGETRLFVGDDNISGILEDTADRNCIYVSEGLAHFVGEGGLLHICGDNIESIYKGDMPIWGLFRESGVMYALMQTGVVPVINKKFSYDLEKKFKDMGLLKLGDIPVAQFGGTLFVYSGARGNDSVGGAGTPFVVILPSGIKPVLSKIQVAHQ